MSEDSLPNKLYTTKTMFTLGGSSAAVWTFCAVLEMVFHIDTDKYKWIGLLTALVVSFVGTIDPKNIKAKILTIAFFNGLMIYLNAVGIDSINQGISKSRAARTTEQASLIPFTNGKAWWPTASLVDSIELMKGVYNSDQQKINALKGRISRLTDSLMKLTNSRDSLLLNSKNAIGKSKKVAEASKEISTAGKVEGCDVLANSKSGIITFYMGCASEIIVKVKGSGKHDISIRTSPEDGMVIKLDDNGKFSVIPKRYKLKLDIVIDGALCNSYSFVIKNLPLPTTKIEIDGNTYDNKLGAPKDAKLLKVVPDIFDEQFFESCPKDAQYEIKSMVFSINGLTPISVNGSTIRFDSYRIKSRDNIQIFNINVVRSTYNGAKVPVEGNNMAVSIRVN